MNIFEQAARGKFRFPSVRGELLMEHLWDLPLKATNGFDLDSVAKEINAAAKASEEESFVEVKTNKISEELVAKLEIVKFVIADKQAEAAKQKTLRENRARRQKLLEALDRKNDSALEAMTPEQLLAELEKVDEAA